MGVPITPAWAMTLPPWRSVHAGLTGQVRYRARSPHNRRFTIGNPERVFLAPFLMPGAEFLAGIVQVPVAAFDVRDELRRIRLLRQFVEHLLAAFVCHV